MSLNIANGDILTTRLIYDSTEDSTIAFNVLHYQISGTNGPAPNMAAALSAIGNALYDMWSAAWRPTASNEVRMTGVGVTSTFPLPRSVTATYTPVTPAAGEIVSDALPLQDCITLLKTSAVGQRWGMGRMYVPGVSEASQSSGVITGLHIVAYGALAEKINDQVQVVLGGWSCSLNPVLVGGPPDNPTRITPITGGRLSNPIIKTQRRRRPGKGS